MVARLIINRWQFRLLTLLLVVSTVGVPLAVCGNHLQRLRRQEAAFKVIAAKGGTIFYSPTHVFVDFSISSKPSGMGVLCSNERVICPNYAHQPSFCDSDLQMLSDIFHLYDIDFRGSKVTEEAARGFQRTHPILSHGLDTVTVD